MRNHRVSSLVHSLLIGVVVFEVLNWSDGRIDCGNS